MDKWAVNFSTVIATILFKEIINKKGTYSKSITIGTCSINLLIQVSNTDSCEPLFFLHLKP